MKNKLFLVNSNTIKTFTSQKKLEQYITMYCNLNNLTVFDWVIDTILEKHNLVKVHKITLI